MKRTRVWCTGAPSAPLTCLFILFSASTGESGFPGFFRSAAGHGQTDMSKHVPVPLPFAGTAVLEVDVLVLGRIDRGHFLGAPLTPPWCARAS